MSTVTNPILLDSTGQQIVQKLSDIKDAIEGIEIGIPIKISITSPPTKTSYVVGETLDLTGIAVYVTFSNHQVYDITDACSYSPAEGAVITDDISLVVSWRHSETGQTFTAQTPITVLIPTWANGTPEQIAAILQAHYDGNINIHNYWNIGEKRVVPLSAMEANIDTTIDGHRYEDSNEAQNVTYVLSESGGKTLSDGETECAFQVDQEYSDSLKIYMNEDDDNTGGWRDCAGRTWTNSIYRNALPSNIKSLFKQFKNSSGQGGESVEGVYETDDYFALRSEVEMLGTHTYSVEGEGEQVTLFETLSNVLACAGTLLRSPALGYTRSFVYITSDQSSGYAWREVIGVENAKSHVTPFGVI